MKTIQTAPVRRSGTDRPVPVHLGDHADALRTGMIAARRPQCRFRATVRGMIARVAHHDAQPLVCDSRRSCRVRGGVSSGRRAGSGARGRVAAVAGPRRSGAVRRGSSGRSSVRSARRSTGAVGVGRSSSRRGPGARRAGQGGRDRACFPVAGRDGCASASSAQPSRRTRRICSPPCSAASPPPVGSSALPKRAAATAGRAVVCGSRAGAVSSCAGAPSVGRQRRQVAPLPPGGGGCRWCVGLAVPGRRPCGGPGCGGSGLRHRLRVAGGCGGLAVAGRRLCGGRGGLRRCQWVGAGLRGCGAQRSCGPWRRSGTRLGGGRRGRVGGAVGRPPRSAAR
jgi:hypothetical protein